MSNSEWDKYLREVLGEFKPEAETPPWEDFAGQLDTTDPASTEPDLLHDDHLKESLSTYKVHGKVKGWERIEASLNAADREFDETIRKKINQYEPTYDPLSWPVFLKRFSDSKQLRVKLITLKVIEVAAVLLLLLSVFNIGRLGKLPFDARIFEEQGKIQPILNSQDDRAEFNNKPAENQLAAKEEKSFPLKSKPLPATHSSQLLKINSISASSILENQDINTPDAIVTKIEDGTALTFQSQNNIDELPSSEGTAGEVSIPSNIATPSVPIIESNVSTENSADDPRSYALIQDAGITEQIAYIPASVVKGKKQIIPEPVFVESVKHPYAEFGVITQVDYNLLRMPEDRLYSAGKQIIFPEKGIQSQGFGAGFTIAIAHPLWALETGLIFSAKNFKPGRQLIVGGAFDNGSVDFEAMKLQMVSLPFQYRYRFDHKGRLKAYGIAGLGVHVIAQSDIDVLIKYHFPSLSFGEDPNSNPKYAETIRETRRISEHIRDGAPFSTKSFFSVNAGLGLEYSLSEHKILFLQTTGQYQIKNIQFSNNNGKHIRSVSLQFGVRSPLGS